MACSKPWAEWPKTSIVRNDNELEQTPPVQAPPSLCQKLRFIMSPGQWKHLRIPKLRIEVGRQIETSQNTKLYQLLLKVWKGFFLVQPEHTTSPCHPTLSASFPPSLSTSPFHPRLLAVPFPPYLSRSLFHPHLLGPSFHPTHSTSLCPPTPLTSPFHPPPLTSLCPPTPSMMPCHLSPSAHCRCHRPCHLRIQKITLVRICWNQHSHSLHPSMHMFLTRVVRTRDCQGSRINHQGSSRDPSKTKFIRTAVIHFVDISPWQPIAFSTNPRNWDDSMQGSEWLTDRETQKIRCHHEVSCICASGTLLTDGRHWVHKPLTMLEDFPIVATKCLERF